MIRLTGGEFRGRSIDTPGDLKTRPTQAKLRQALFNSLQNQIPDARVLDLFSGSGALGFEALSRGAGSVVFVEQSHSACKVIEKNAATLGVKDRIRILATGIDQAWSRLKAKAPFEIILADPPYERGWETKLPPLPIWEDLLVPEGLLCLEWGAQKSKIKNLPDRSGFLVKVREKNYGDSVLTTFTRSVNCEDVS